MRADDLRTVMDAASLGAVGSSQTGQPAGDRRAVGRPAIGGTLGHADQKSTLSAGNRWSGLA
jgi:hypothetical protein